MRMFPPIFIGNVSNWTALTQLAQPTAEGSFFPFGPFGVVEGATICLFIFIGLDHTVNAKSNSRSIFGLVTFGLSTVFILAACIILTILLPYYQQVCNFSAVICYFVSLFLSMLSSTG